VEVRVIGRDPEPGDVHRVVRELRRAFRRHEDRRGGSVKGGSERPGR
jgi:hypothetical protein